MVTTKRDYYEILGIGRGTSTEEVKRAYRGLALKHHPDRVQPDHKKEAEEKFKEISEAYAVLSDSKKRSVYDQYGHAGFDQRFSTEDIFRGADFSSIFEDLGVGGSIFEDLLSGFGFDLFGGGRAARGGRGRDMEVELILSFEEAAQGVSKTVKLPRRELCSECRGEGGDRADCSACQGTGQIRQSAGFMVIARSCSRCAGQGSVIKRACSACHGDGRVTVERRIQVKVPAGVEHGMRLRLAGEGEGGKRARGDLYVYLGVKEHPIFRRDGPNLLIEYPINIAQAALGASVDVPTLNGRVSMKIPAGIQSGTVMRIRGKGLPDVHGGRQGDLLVQAVVETPTNLSATQRRLLEEVGKAFGTNVYPAQQSFLSRLKNLLKKR